MTYLEAMMPLSDMNPIIPNLNIRYDKEISGDPNIIHVYLYCLHVAILRPDTDGVYMVELCNIGDAVEIIEGKHEVHSFIVKSCSDFILGALKTTELK
jgi:hypothetical protein